MTVRVCCEWGVAILLLAVLACGVCLFVGSTL
jgi:hypothetical protein